MSYVKTQNGQAASYPYTAGQLRRDNPNVSFPKDISDSILSDFGVLPVLVEEKPVADERSKNITCNALPELEGGAWVLKWSISDKTADEIAAYDDLEADLNRYKRNNLLAATDYFALTDVTMYAPMTTYRQALRDITSHANWPHLSDDDWPTSPA